MAVGSWSSSNYAYASVGPGYNAGLGIAFWCNFDGTAPSGEQYVFSRAANFQPSVRHISVMLTASGGWKVQMQANLSNGTATTSANMAGSGWHHVFAYATTNLRAVYFNGTNRGSSTNNVGGSAYPRTIIGAKMTATTPTFSNHFDSGDLAEMLEFHDASTLSLTELDNLAVSLYRGHHAEAQILNPGQWRYWPFVTKNLRSWGSVPTNLTEVGTLTKTDHVPIRGRTPFRALVAPLAATGRIIKLDGSVRTSKVVLLG